MHLDKVATAPGPLWGEIDNLIGQKSPPPTTGRSPFSPTSGTQRPVLPRRRPTTTAEPGRCARPTGPNRRSWAVWTPPLIRGPCPYGPVPVRSHAEVSRCDGTVT